MPVNNKYLNFYGHGVPDPTPELQQSLESEFGGDSELERALHDQAISDHKKHVISERYRNLSHEALQQKDWNSATEYAKKASEFGNGLTAWNDIARATPPHDVINQSLDMLGNSPLKDEFIYNIATNQNYFNNQGGKDVNSSGSKILPKELIDRMVHIAQNGKGPGGGSRRTALSYFRDNHPMYDHGPHDVADMWHDYEKSVQPSHFAAVEHHMTGQPVKLVDHRGKEGDSSEYSMALPHLGKYAKMAQEAVLQDRGRPDEDDEFTVKPEIRMVRGKPFVKTYRGIAGDYADAIGNHAGLDEHGNADNATLKIPVSSLSSWTTNPQVAQRFATRPIKNQANRSLIMHKWMPLEHLLHSGFHQVVPNHPHAHPGESELIFKHDKKHVKVPTSQLYYPKKHDLTPEELEKETRYAFKKNFKKEFAHVTNSYMGYGPFDASPEAKESFDNMHLDKGHVKAFQDAERAANDWEHPITNTHVPYVKMAREHFPESFPSFDEHGQLHKYLVDQHLADTGKSQPLEFHPVKVRSQNTQSIPEHALKPVEIDKAEFWAPMHKMAIADIPKPPASNPEGTSAYYDHVIPKEHQNRYSIHTSFDKDNDYTTHLLDKKTGQKAGYATATMRGDALRPFDVEIGKEHRGKGLGLALYEAMYAHAYHNGIRKVTGGRHSTMASKGIHQKLAVKHGLEYVPEPDYGDGSPTYENRKEWLKGPTGAYDEKYKPYSYDLKNELAMNKTMPGPKFPKLGLPDDRKETPIVNESQLNTKAKLMASRHANLNGLKGPGRQYFVEDQHAENKTFAGASDASPGSDRNVLSWSKANELRNPMHAGSNTGNADMSTQLHENLHNMFNRVQGKFGQAARFSLAKKMATSIPIQNRQHLQKFFDTKTRFPKTDPMYHEEMLASMLNYLNNPKERSMYHDFLGHNDVQRMDTHDNVKLAHRHIMNISRNVDQKWLNGTQHMLTKAEEHDEVSRMLRHPNVTERKMALKLSSVNGDHLKRALYDEDPGIQKDAMAHPAMSHDVLDALMRMPGSEGLQLQGMMHPFFDKHHLKTLYRTHAGKEGDKSKAVLDAIGSHNLLDGDMIRDMHKDGNLTRGVVANLNTPADVISDIVDQHFAPGHDQKSAHRYLTMEALKHPNVTTQHVEKAIKEGDDGIKLAAANSHALPANVAEDILKRGHLPASHGESFLRSALVSSPHATERHLDMGMEDLNPLVRSAVFNTKSPNLKAKHVERAIEQGHPHSILMALKSAAADHGHVMKLSQDKRPELSKLATDYVNRSIIRKFQDELDMFKSDRNLGNELDGNSEIVQDMLGYDHHKHNSMEAAKFLVSGNEPSLEQVRHAFWKADGDAEKAALIAHGMDPTESNLRALRGVRDLQNTKKAEKEAVEIKDVQAGTPEGQKTAEAIQRAVKDRYVFPIEMAGKHSKGSMIARDTVGGEVYLLKPGSGDISPAAGDDEEQASQSRREAAFYHIAEKWGLGEYLPHCDLLLLDGKEFACMQLLPWKYKTIDKLKKTDPSVGPRLLAPYLDSGVIFKWAVLDAVLGNPDRHANNLMADTTGDTPQGDVKLIDHGSAMAGKDFDPAHDENSFVPYYLRAWATGSFNSMDEEQKLKVMPRLSGPAIDEIHEWMGTINAHELQLELTRYGIDPEPAMERLARLRTMMEEDPVDLAINRFWVET